MEIASKIAPQTMPISATLKTGKLIILNSIKSITNPLKILSTRLPIAPPRIAPKQIFENSELVIFGDMNKTKQITATATIAKI